MSFIREKLLDKKFYRESMSLFMRGVPGIEERVDMWVDVLKNVNDCGDDIFRYLDIFYYNNADDNYLTFIKGRNPGGASCVWLDIIAAIYGLRREIVLVEFIKNGGNVENPVAAQVTLNDRELLIYIEATLRRFLFNGTRLSLRQAYEGTTLVNGAKYEEVFGSDSEIKEYLAHVTHKSVLSELGIVYIDGSAPAECNICMTNAASASDNLLNLFLNGYLTIESMGITYAKLLSKDFETGKWNESKYYKPLTPPYALYARKEDAI